MTEVRILQIDGQENGLKQEATAIDPMFLTMQSPLAESKQDHLRLLNAEKMNVRARHSGHKMATMMSLVQINTFHRGDGGQSGSRNLSRLPNWKSLCVKGEILRRLSQSGKDAEQDLDE